MSYGADFASADPAHAPLDPPILIGADPAMWAVLALFLLAAGAVGYWLGARSGPKHADDAGPIWKAVDSAAKDAMKADNAALVARAQKLVQVIDGRLGRTLRVATGGAGLATLVEALRLAGDGRRADACDGHGGHGGHGGGHDHDAGHGGEHDHDAAPAPSAAAITINVAGGSVRTGGGDHPPAPPAEMTAREQAEALRLAVAAFNEHWRHEAVRIAELRAALAELSGGR